MTGSVLVWGWPADAVTELTAKLVPYGGRAALNTWPGGSDSESTVTWGCERPDSTAREQCAEVFADWCHQYGFGNVDDRY
jgi:hypothetical protein